jgi:hypothetical protein
MSDEPKMVEMKGEPATLTYTNYRGETAERVIEPKSIWFGATEWHRNPQWFVRALDIDKGEMRDFALKDFGQPGAALDRSGGVGVKPLIWEDDTAGWRARDPWGEHYTVEIDGDGFVVSHTALINDMHCKSEEEAKAAGQADFDSRIRSALVDAPDPVASRREAREEAREAALRELLAKWVQRDESLAAAYDAAGDEHSEGDEGNANDIVEATLRALIDQEPSDG